MISDRDRIFKNLPTEQELFAPQAREQGDWVDLESLLRRGRVDLYQSISESGLQEKDRWAENVSEKWHPYMGGQDKPYMVIDGGPGAPGEVGFLHLIYYETYKLVEGIILAAFVVDSPHAYIYVSADQKRAFDILERVIQEAYEAGILGENILGTGFTFNLHIHVGSSQYVSYHPHSVVHDLAGDEQPEGLLWGRKVVVHKVETVAALSTVLKRGKEWFLGLGTPGSRGTKIFSFSGHVNNPCVIEEQFGVLLRATLEHYADGVKGGWSHLNGIFPGGIASPFLMKSFCQDLTLSYEGMAKYHSFLGSGGMVIVNGSVSILTATLTALAFLAPFASKKCIFCSKGLNLCLGALREIQHHEKDLSFVVNLYGKLEELATRIKRRCQCGYAVEALHPIHRYLQYAQEEMAEIAIPLDGFDKPSGDEKEALHVL